MADTHKWIEYKPRALDPVQLHAHLRNLGRKRRRVRALFVAALDRLIGHKPGVATAAPIGAIGAAKTGDIALVLILDANR